MSNPSNTMWKDSLGSNVNSKKSQHAIFQDAILHYEYFQENWKVSFEFLTHEAIFDTNGIVMF